MSVETLSLAAGALLSLSFSYIPGLSGWFDGKTPTLKRGIMALALLVIALLVLAASCAHLEIPGVQIECSAAGVWTLVQVYLLALVANQGTYALSGASATKKTAS